MSNAASLFTKYKEILVPPERTVVKAFAAVVEEVCGLSVAREMVRYHPPTKTLYIQTPGAFKQEILIHQEEIIRRLHAHLGATRAPQKLQ